MHFSDLRVINHDFISPDSGFPTHPHRDMEIVTYVLKGTVEHEDSMGNKKQIPAGDIQVMSAGTGVFHSEYNPSGDEELELLQIWMMPSAPGGTPSYGQKKFTEEERRKGLTRLVSRDGVEGSLHIKQNASIFALILEPGKSREIPLEPTHSYWLQVARGGLQISSPEPVDLSVGDAISLGAGEWPELKIKANQECELLLFELRG